MKPPCAFALPALLSAVLASCPVDRCAGEEVVYEQKIRARPFPILVPTNFDGVVVPLALDTGSYCHALDTSMRSHFGRYIQIAELKGPFGRTMRMMNFEAPNMAVGNWKLPPGDLVEMTSVPFQNLLGVEMKGCLGLGALRQVALDVDFDDEKLRFIRDFRAPSSTTLFLPGDKRGGMKYLPVKIIDGLPIVRITIDGAPINAAIDTGGSSVISLRTETFDKLVASGAITRPVDSQEVFNETAAGTIKIRAGRFTRGNLWGVDLQGARVDEAETIDSVNFLFLLNFNFIYDVPSGLFYFAQRHGEPPIDCEAMAGAEFIYPEGHCHVFALRERGGPAEAAGIRKDEVILRLGPLHEKDLNGFSVYDLCETHAGQPIEVEIVRTGEPQTIKTKLKLLEKQFIYPPTP